MVGHLRLAVAFAPCLRCASAALAGAFFLAVGFAALGFVVGGFVVLGRGLGLPPRRLAGPRRPART